MQAKESAYRKVAADRRAQILGQLFPHRAAFADRGRAGTVVLRQRQTVRRAIHDLVAEGLASRVPGSRTFATPRASGTFPSSARWRTSWPSQPTARYMTSGACTTAVDPAAASRLRLSDDHVATASFVRLHDGQPFASTRVCLPPPVGAPWPPGSPSNRPRAKSCSARVAGCLVGTSLMPESISWASARDILDRYVRPATAALPSWTRQRQGRAVDTPPNK